MGVSFPDGFWCCCCSLSWILCSFGALWGFEAERFHSGWWREGKRQSQAVRGSCDGSTAWAEGGGDMAQVSPSSLPGAALCILLSTFLLQHPVMQPAWEAKFSPCTWNKQLPQNSDIFKLLQQFLSSPLSGPAAKHMARPFICFNYSCAVEWHLWIIGNVRL